MHHLHPHQHHSPDRGGFSRRRLLSVLLVAQLMVILDISAVNVALPDLAKDLQIGASEIGWTIISYSLMFGSLLLLGGRAADLLGRRRVFFTGLTVFTVSSLASALAVSSTALFAARAGQGLGAALLSPAALSIITTSFHGKERAHAFGAWGAVGGAGAAAGVLLGGLLTQAAGWRAVFYINVPVALALAAAGRTVVPADAHPPRWRGLDLRGAALATGSLAALVYALSRAATAGWTSAATVGFGLAGLLGLAAFTLVELHSTQPLLCVQRLADRAVGGGFALMLIASGVIFGGFLLTSLYLQNILHLGPLATGLGFLPFALSVGAGAHLGSQTVARFGVRAPMAAGFAVAAAGLLTLTGIDNGGNYLTDVLPGLTILGLGIGPVLASVVFCVFSSARDEETGMLSGLNATGHEIGGTLGIAVLVTIATAGAGSAIGSISASGIDNAFLAASSLAALGSLLALVVLPPAQRFLPKLQLAPRAMPMH